VWVRRGLWQKKPQRFVLGLQSAMMDKVIEPGDIARAYDFGPTAKRKDSVLTSPVSLFRKEDAMSREDARRALGLDLNRPTVLVQLGTGEGDVNEKMTAALSGLLGWKDLQVILTKAPVDKDGKSLAPEGLDLKVARYFPLAKVLHAFDAGICATGYNGVHELLPAQLPTVFVSNIRGTDDQEARAKWCHDFGYALRADQAELPDTTGGQEIAAMLYKLATEEAPKKASGFTFKRLMVQERINRGMRHVINLGLRRLALVYRFLHPHIVTQIVRVETPVFGSQSTAAELHPLIKGDTRFEHMISGASDRYRKRREEIADAAYGKQLQVSKTK
jgi:hypothetical protein